jgi:hypothetical protein
MESAVNKNLQNLLEHLGDVLDSDRQAKIEDLHRRALNWEPVDRLPVIVTLPAPRQLRWAPYPHGEVFESPEKMLFNELVYAFNTSIASRDVLGDDLPCTIRANFGTVVIASVFGACVEQIDDNPPCGPRSVGFLERLVPAGSSDVPILSERISGLSQTEAAYQSGIAGPARAFRQS